MVMDLFVALCIPQCGNVMQMKNLKLRIKNMDGEKPQKKDWLLKILHFTFLILNLIKFSHKPTPSPHAPAAGRAFQI